MLGKIEAGGGEFQFLEIIGTNVLANELVRYFSNLTANECWESAKHVLRVKRALGGIIDLYHQSTCRDTKGIVKGKCRDISSVSQLVEGVREGRIVN